MKLFGNDLTKDTGAELLLAPEDAVGGGDPLPEFNAAGAPSDEALVAQVKALTDEAVSEAEATAALLKAETPASQPEAEAAPAPEAPKNGAAAQEQTAAEEDTLDKDILNTIAATVASAEKRAEPIRTEARGDAQTSGDTKEMSISYVSTAEAMNNARKGATGRYTREPVDDDAFLAEIHALIGDGAKPTPQPTAHEAVSAARPVPPPRPVARLTQDALTDVPEEFEAVVREDAAGVSGVAKGLFILLVSMLLGAMTFYAVASDVLGKVF